MSNDCHFTVEILEPNCHDNETNHMLLDANIIFFNQAKTEKVLSFVSRNKIKYYKEAQVIFSPTYPYST